MRKHKHDIFEVKKKIFSEKKQGQSFICVKNCKINIFLALLELCAFYIEFKKVKFTVTNFRGRTNVKHLIQTQLLRFCKDTTTKVSSHT